MKHHVDVTLRDGKVERHSFKTEAEKRAFIRGLSTTGWRSYAFDDWIPERAVRARRKAS